jgi:hypothetical protein
MSTDEIAGPDQREQRKDAVEGAQVRAMVARLREQLDDGAEVVEGLGAELARCGEAIAEVGGVLAATVRHAEGVLLVVDHELTVRFASPAAAALLGEGGSLHQVLPRGGAFALRRFLGFAADAEAEPDGTGAAEVMGGNGRRRPRPRGRMTLAGDGVEVTVRRVEPVLGSLGGLWGAAPGRAHGLVRITPCGDDGAPAGGAGVSPASRRPGR